jgi:dTDP-4-dehydrorhamnose reductase
MAVLLTPDSLPLLITGITGVAGFHALSYFQERYPGRVIGVRPTATWQMIGPGILALDIEDEAGLRELFRAWGFRSVLNTTGNCALKVCELVPEIAYRTNVQSAANVARLAKEFGARLVHLSSDLVFSGLKGEPYLESDRTDPVSVYGKTMVQGEAIVTATDPDAAILRISLPMGPSFNGHAGAIDWIQSRFRANRPATLYFDEVRCPTYVEDLSRVCEHLLVLNAAGLYHAGGPRGITLYQIAQVINRVGDYDPRLLRGMPRREAGPIPPRAGDCRMDSSKLVRLLSEANGRSGGSPFQSWPLGEELMTTDAHWHFQRPAEEDNGPARLATRLYQYPITLCHAPAATGRPDAAPGL